ncbi:hypothetical protein [Pelobium manganitolerans]
MQIKSGAITADKIGSGTIQGYNLQDGAVYDAKIQNGTISNAKLAGNISKDKLAWDAVTDAAIAYKAISVSKLSTTGGNNGDVLTNVYGEWKPVAPASGASDATASAKGIIQLSGDLTGSATSPTIANNAITSAKIADNTIATADLANNAVTTAKIATSAVTANELANGSVTAVKLNSMSATSGQVLKYNGTTWAPANEASANNWSMTGNSNTTSSSFLGTTNDAVFKIGSNNTQMLQFGRRQTLGLTQSYTDYTDNSQPLVYINGNGTTSALQFAASAADFYKPMFFTTTEGNFRLKGSAAGTDYFEIGSSGTSNNGRLDFIIGDDGDEPIVFSKYNYSPAGNVEMLRMQGTGLNNDVRVGINTAGVTADSELQVVGNTHTSTLQVGSNTVINGIYKTTIASGSFTVSAYTSSTNRTYTLSGITGLDANTATVMVSPRSALPATVAIGYARVVGTNKIEISFNNTNTAVTMSDTQLNITIIQ